VPPPTTVCQSPQRSTTTRSTVAAAPSLARRTTNVVWVVPAGSVTLKLPVAPVCPPGTSISAFVAAPKRSATRELFGVPALLVAVTVTCRRPAPAGVADTPTLGRGEHGAAAGTAPVGTAVRRAVGGGRGGA